LLTSATVASADPLSTSGFFYHSISDYFLGSGSYTIGGLNVSTGSNGFYRLASGTTTPSAITYGAGVYTPGSSLTYPTLLSDQGISYFGPNFKFSYIPAPTISLNFGSDVNANTAVGSNTAGVTPVGNWNDVPLAWQTNMPLKDWSGSTVPGLTLSTSQTFVVPTSANDAASGPGGPLAFTAAGDNAMMRGHIYHSGGTNLDLTFTGTIPYDKFDLYIYYNSGAVTNTETFSILDSGGGSLGLSRTGSEVPGADGSFVLSDGMGNNANYVRFAGLTSADVPTNFIIRISGTGYTYIDGLQFVQLVPEPQSFVMALAALCGLGCFGLVCRRRREA
jgi:PEP-CTERM motif